MGLDMHSAAGLQISSPGVCRVHLQTQVFEDGVHAFTEDIFETVHDRGAILTMLARRGFQVLKCAHRLSDTDGPEAATWFLIARRPL